MIQFQTQVSDHLSEENHDLNSNSGLRSPDRKTMTQTQIQVSDLLTEESFYSVL